MNQNTVFSKTYADHYDLFYRNKDYEAECDFLERVFQHFASSPVHSILDLGCGTGGHALPLAERGYSVVGVDRSAEMLQIAQSKLAASGCGQSVVFRQGDIRTLNLNRTFDAVIMMFAVLSYQTSNEDLAAALATVRRHLTPGGLFVADFWYGPAVLAQRPGDRVGEWRENGQRVLRLVRSQLDALHHKVQVHYHILRLQGTQVIAETEETHIMRFLFPQELAYFAAQADLELVHLCPFLTLDGQPDEGAWNVSAVMQALPLTSGRGNSL